MRKHFIRPSRRSSLFHRLHPSSPWYRRRAVQSGCMLRQRCTTVPLEGTFPDSIPSPGCRWRCRSIPHHPPILNLNQSIMHHNYNQVNQLFHECCGVSKVDFNFGFKKNWPEEHSCSSDPSLQSIAESQTELRAMHTPLSWHLKSSSWHTATSKLISFFFKVVIML